MSISTFLTQGRIIESAAPRYQSCALTTHVSNLEKRRSYYAGSRRSPIWTARSSRPTTLSSMLGERSLDLWTSGPQKSLINLQTAICLARQGAPTHAWWHFISAAESGSSPNLSQLCRKWRHINTSFWGAARCCLSVWPHLLYSSIQVTSSCDSPP